MKTALFQMDVAWQDNAANLSKAEEWILNRSEDADLVILPEMFNTGFMNNPQTYAQTMDGETLTRLKAVSAQSGKAVAGSMVVQERGRFFNRFFFIVPQGKVYTYDKKHLFRMSEEHDHYSAGKKKIVIEYKDVRILPLVCYDLRFPVWSRNRENEYDLAIYVASWPASRRYAWDTLLKARAIENQSYVIGVNRCGADPNVDYSGGTVLIDFLGQVRAQAEEGKESMAFGEIDLEAVRRFRCKFPAYLDADLFQLR